MPYDVGFCNARMPSMDLVFDIATSAGFWREWYPANRAPKPPEPVVLSQCAFREEDVMRLAPAWAARNASPGDGSMHLMVFEPGQRRRSQVHVTHVWSGAVPEGSFYRLGESQVVTSPAFMFLAAGATLSLPALVAFGCELCGCYSFDAREERGFRTRSEPLLTPDQLRLFLAGAQGCRGYRRAVSALPHVVAGSASPMETFDALAMSLPYRLGGYGLAKPAMNYEVKLSEKAARIARRATCYADMCYIDTSRADLKIDIEHHGKLDHSSDEDRASDRARVNGLKEMGFEVVELTKDQVYDLVAFEYIVERLAKLLGKRIRKDKLGPIPARLAFRKEVLAWNRSSGRLR